MMLRSPEPQQSLERKKPELDSETQKCLDLFKNQEFSQAIDAATVAMKKPNNAIAFFVRGLSRAFMKQDKLARNDLLDGIKIESQIEEGEPHTLHGAVLECLLTYEEAVGHKKLQVSIEPRLNLDKKPKKPNLFKQAREFFINKNFKKAIEVLNIILTEDPADAQVYLDRGLAYLHLTKDPKDPRVVENFYLSVWLSQTNFGYQFTDYVTKCLWMKTLRHLAFGELEKSIMTLNHFCEMLQQGQEKAPVHNKIRVKILRKKLLNPIEANDHFGIHASFVNLLSPSIFMQMPKQGFEVFLQTAKKLYEKEKEFYQAQLDPQIREMACQINKSCMPPEKETASPTADVVVQESHVPITSEELKKTSSPVLKLTTDEVKPALPTNQVKNLEYCQKNFQFIPLNCYYSEMISTGKSLSEAKNFAGALITFEGALKFCDEGLTTGSKLKTIFALLYLRDNYIDNRLFYFEYDQEKWKDKLVDVTERIIAECDKMMEENPIYAKGFQLDAYATQLQLYSTFKELEEQNKRRLVRAASARKNDKEFQNTIKNKINKSISEAEKWQKKADQVEKNGERLDREIAALKKSHEFVDSETAEHEIQPSVQKEFKDVENYQRFMQVPPLSILHEGVQLFKAGNYKDAYRAFVVGINGINNSTNTDPDFLTVAKRAKIQIISSEFKECEKKLFHDNAEFKHKALNKFDLVLEANRKFFQKKYSSAAMYLTCAIQKDSLNHALYANRALTFFLLNKNPIGVLDNLAVAICLCHSNIQKLNYYWLRARVYHAYGDVENNQRDMVEVIRIITEQKLGAKSKDSGKIDQQIVKPWTAGKHELAIQNLFQLLIDPDFLELSAKELDSLIELCQKINDFEKTVFFPPVKMADEAKTQIVEDQPKTKKPKKKKHTSDVLPEFRIEVAEEAIKELKKTSVIILNKPAKKINPADNEFTPKLRQVGAKNEATDSEQEVADAEEELTQPLKTVLDLKTVNEEEIEFVQPPSPRYEYIPVCSSNFLFFNSDKTHKANNDLDPRLNIEKFATKLTVKVPSMVAECARLLDSCAPTFVSGNLMRNPLMGVEEQIKDADMLTWASEEQIKSILPKDKYFVRPGSKPGLFIVSKIKNPEEYIEVFKSPFPNLLIHARNGDVTLNDNWGRVKKDEDVAVVYRMLRQTKKHFYNKCIGIVKPPENKDPTQQINIKVNEYIKLLRAVNYSSRFKNKGYTLADDTPDIARKMVNDFDFSSFSSDHLSMINSIFAKLFTNGYALENFQVLAKLGIIQHAFPFLAPLIEKDKLNPKLVELLTNIVPNGASRTSVKDIYTSFVYVSSADHSVFTQNCLIKTAFMRSNKVNPDIPQNNEASILMGIIRNAGVHKFFRRKFEQTAPYVPIRNREKAHSIL